MTDRQYNYTSYMIKKSNLLIEKSNTFSFNNQKIFNLILSEIYKNGLTDNQILIPVKKLVDLVGEKQVYRTKMFYQNIGKNLVSNTLDLIEPNENLCDITSLISRFKLEKAFIHIKVTEELKSLMNLDHILPNGDKLIDYGYTKLNLNIINELKSKHSIVLYEYCMMKLKYSTYHRKNKFSVIQKFDIEKLRKLLCNNKKSYEDVNLLIRKILKPAINEINSKTDLAIDFKPIKCEFNKKTIKGFEFSIKQNEYESTESTNEKAKNSDKDNKQLEIGIIPPEIKNHKTDDLMDNKITNTIISQGSSPTIKIHNSMQSMGSILSSMFSNNNKNFNNKREIPGLVRIINNLGVAPLEMVMAWYDSEPVRLANIYDLTVFKYGEFGYLDQAKIIASMFRKGVDPAIENPTQIIPKAHIKDIEQEAIERKIEQQKYEERKDLSKEEIEKLDYEEFHTELEKPDSLLSTVWRTFVKAMNYNEGDFYTWIKPLIPKFKNENHLVVSAPNRYKAEFFLKKMQYELEKIARRYNDNCRVSCAIR